MFMIANADKEIAKALLDTKAVFLQPNDMFTWASGIKSPIYCDNRITLSCPKTRTLIKNSFVEMIKENYPEVELIAGVATAGIPQAALVAEAMKLPMIYVRSSAKDHGRTNQIEGRLEKGSKVVVIEDLISTGGSSLKAVEALKEAGADVLGLAAIFTYNLDKAKNAFQEADVKYLTLSSYDVLLGLAKESGSYSNEEISILENWRSSI